MRFVIMNLAVLLASCGSSQRTETTPTDEDPPRNAALGMYMREHVNPAFSQLAFMLFHSEEEEGGEQDVGKTLRHSSRELRKATEQLVKWDELGSYSKQAMQVFHEYAALMKTDVVKLDAAIHDDKLDDARAAFENVQRKCDSCHHFFRYEEPVGTDVGMRHSRDR